MGLITERTDLDALLLNSIYQCNSIDEIRNATRKLNSNIESYYNQDNSFRLFKDWSSVGSGASVYVEVHTGANYFKILDVNVLSSGSPLTVSLTEAPTLTEGTNQLYQNVIHRTSQYDAVSLTYLYDNPTVISGGLLIDEYYLYHNALTTKNISKMEPMDSNQRILLPDTVYLYKITNNDTSSSSIFFKLNWIELVNVTY